MKSMTFVLILLLMPMKALAGPNVENANKINIPTTCLEYSRETVCYPSSWKHLPLHHTGQQMGSQEEFLLNTRHGGMINLDKTGNAARDWAYAKVGLAHKISSAIPGSDIAKHALAWKPCSGATRSDCFQTLPASEINGIEMFFYEITRAGKGESQIRSVYVFFSTGGNPYWLSFCAHNLDFDRYWPYFEAILHTFKTKEPSPK